MKNNKGITLIALVITIIVMLILVGVTITVAMQGGLFNTARKAATGTEAEKEKELQVASGIYEGKTLEEWAAGEVAAGDNVGETIEQSTEVGGKILYSYDGTKANEKAWTVLHNYGDTIEIVSPEALGELTLGAGYEGNVGDIDEDGVSNTEMDKAIYSCNNAAEIINNYCQSIVTNPNRITSRSFEVSDYSEEFHYNKGAYDGPQLPDGLITTSLVQSGDLAIDFRIEYLSCHIAIGGVLVSDSLVSHWRIIRK